MSCSKKMIRLALIVAAALVAAYFVFPQFHAFIIGIAPVLLALLCPLSMLFMMRGMGSHDRQHEKQSDAGQTPKPVSPTTLQK